MFGLLWYLLLFTFFYQSDLYLVLINVWHSSTYIIVEHTTTNTILQWIESVCIFLPMTTNTEIRHGRALNVNCVIYFTWVYKRTSSASAEKVTPVCFGSEALSDTPYGRMIFTCFLQPRKEDKTHQFFSTYASCYLSTLSLLSLLVHYTLHTCCVDVSFYTRWSISLE